MKLKQSDRRGFSARSTGALDTKSLPTRSFKSKSHLERISSSCIRFGEFESLNFSIGVLPEDIAKRYLYDVVSGLKYCIIFSFLF